MLGKISVSYSDLNRMTLRDMVNAMRGYSEMVRDRDESLRDVMYGAARFNAYFTASSGDAQKKLRRHHFPWEKKRPVEGSGMTTYKDMLPFLNSISKN